VVGEKGVLQARAVATGAGAHGSRPWLARNPIAALCALHDDLKSRWPDPHDEDDWRPSVTLARLDGGHAANRVPDRAEAAFDVRFGDDVDQGEVVQVLRRAAADHDVELDLDNLAAATSYDLATPLGEAWLTALAEVAGRDEAPTVRTAGASNGRFWHSAGAQVLMANPTSGNAHASDEWVAIGALEPFVELVDRTVTLAHEHHG
jgi:acetylornithine deacetylase/succinyl-diaminopimelate desuccinylase-like protein